MPDTSKNGKMELTELYKLCENKGIKVTDFLLPETKAICINIGENCYVGIDPAVFGRAFEEKVVLAHELGHIETGSFYTEQNSEAARKEQEAKAHRWAILTLVPQEELIKAIKNGCPDVTFLAEHFEVTEEFMSDALLFYYKQKAGL